MKKATPKAKKPSSAPKPKTQVGKQSAADQKADLKEMKVLYDNAFKKGFRQGARSAARSAGRKAGIEQGKRFKSS